MFVFYRNKYQRKYEWKQKRGPAKKTLQKKAPCLKEARVAYNIPSKNAEDISWWYCSIQLKIVLLLWADLNLNILSQKP